MSLDSPVVLLVDDHPDSGEVYAAGLLATGFRPFIAETADEAFEAACRFRPDVVVTDINLPGTSGVDLSRRLRTDARTRDVAIIVLSGHALGSTRQDASSAGCDRFLLKPCVPDVLAFEICDVLAERRWLSTGIHP